jgi:hypothetical protein
MFPDCDNLIEQPFGVNPGSTQSGQKVRTSPARIVPGDVPCAANQASNALPTQAGKQ